MCGDERQDLDSVRSKAVIGLRRVVDAHDNATVGFIHWVWFLLPCDRAAASAAIELRQAVGAPSALEMSAASPQRLLSEDAGDLAGVTRQGNREGVLTLSETERQTLLASTFEVAPKGAVECGGVEAGYAGHQAGPRQRTQTAQLYSPQVLGPYCHVSFTRGCVGVSGGSILRFNRSCRCAEC